VNDTATPSLRARGRRGVAAAVCLVSACAALALGGVTPAAAAPAAPTSAVAQAVTVGDTAPGTARVWSTTGDGALRMSAAAPVTATTTTSSQLPAITVDAAGTGQAVTGFGAALTHSSASLLAALPADQRRAVLRDLFAPDGPVRLSVLRVPLGGSDFVLGRPYTYDDRAGNLTDWTLKRFSTSPDDAVLRPVLREIRAINPDVVLVASPWSPPAWMKTSKDLRGGRLSTDYRAVGAYADYLLRALTEYRAAGLPIDYLTVQNEPQTRTWADYPRMDMPARTQIQVVNALGPRIRTAGLRTQILGFDHNWAQHPADVAAVPAGGDPEHDYPARVLRSTAGQYVAGTAFHCYYGDASAQEPLRAEFPTKSIWVTECSGSHAPTDTAGRIFADTVYWQSKNLVIASLRHWATSVVTWNLALDAQGGPHTGGCTTCTGVVTVQDGKVTPNAEYYVLSQAARFLPRGSVRVSSSTTTSALDQVAFRAPDGTTTVLVHHSGWPAAPVRVQVGGRSYDVTLPPWSVSTIRVAPGA
jgi:glucosylceramidase